MASFDVTIDDQARDIAEQLVGPDARQGALKAVQRGVVKQLQSHFARRDKTPNRLGGKRTHFWGQIRKATSAGKVTTNRAVVTVADYRFAQKLHGGTIRPKRSKMLAIPIRPEAHGVRPRVLEDRLGIDMFVRSSSGRVWLAGKAPDGSLRVYYVLKKSVTQKADPDALPPEAAVDETIDRALEAFFSARGF